MRVSSDLSALNKFSHHSSWLELIRKGMGNESPVPVNIGEMDWDGLFAFLKQQTLVGIGWKGVERFANAMPRNTRVQWYMLTEYVRKRNEWLNWKVTQLTTTFREGGFDVVLLKGQGNATLYPEPLLRMPGDIDLLVRGKKEDVVRFIKEHWQVTGVHFQHVEFRVEKVTVEVHLMPCSMNNPLYLRRMLRWLEAEAKWDNLVELQGNAGVVAVPTDRYNIVFLLAHIMHHFFDEGISLRQLMDYYYLLLHYQKKEGEMKLQEWEATLKYLNLYHFAGAVMYVLKVVFQMSDSLLLAPVDERRGKILLNEILKGGNFGRYSGLTNHSMAVKYLLKTCRNMNFVSQYPAEALCEPLFRTWHFLWRHGASLK